MTESTEYDEPGSAPHAEEVDAVEYVDIYPEVGQESATAKALLDAADDPAEVLSTSDGFRVPAHVADAAEANIPVGDDEVGDDLNKDGTVSEYEKTLKPDLETLAKSRDLDASGTKAEIIARLEADDAAKAAPPA